MSGPIDRQVAIKALNGNSAYSSLRFGSRVLLDQDTRYGGDIMQVHIPVLSGAHYLIWRPRSDQLDDGSSSGKSQQEDCKHGRGHRGPMSAPPPVSRFPFCLYTRFLTPNYQPLPVTGPPTGPLKIALIRSIRKGALFGGEYWARRSKTRDVLKPVPLLVIMGDQAHQYSGALSVSSG